MQVSPCSTTPPPRTPAERFGYLPSRSSVERASEGLESVQQLAIASEAGRRAPWILPPISKRWREPIGVRLMLAFLGWVLEGSVRPRRARGGTGAVLCDEARRTLVGSLETRDHAGKLAPGAWPRLLRCSAGQARRCIHLAERLGLVEQIRNRDPRRGARCELAAAYLPTEKLLDWMHERRPADDVFELPEKTEKCQTPEGSPESYVGEPFAVSALPEAGHRAPDETGASEARSPEAHSPSEERTPEAVTVRGAAEGEGGGDPPGGNVLAFPTWPRPEPSPSEPAVSPDELNAFARMLVERLAEPKPTASELERRRRAVKAQADRIARREAAAKWEARCEREARGDDPPGSDGPGGVA
jgi:hypothetical protein